MRRRKGLVGLGAVVLIALLCFVFRGSLLAAVGRFLVSSDQPARADVVVLTPESDLSGSIEIADLYQEGLADRVLLLDWGQTAIDRELERRGVELPEFTLDALVQMGVPPHAITRLDSGEGGTTASTRTLAEWAAAHDDVQRAIVIVSPTHGRRYRRALLRVWPDDRPAPLVVTTRYHPFQPETWWQSRGTLREGIVELEKLALDYVGHPF